MADANHGFERHVAGEAPDGSRVSSQIRPDGDIVLADEVVACFVVPRCLSAAQTPSAGRRLLRGLGAARERVSACYALTDAAPALLVLGSSLAVMSRLRFVRHAAKQGSPSWR